MREEKEETGKKGEGQEGKRVTGRRKGGRAICIPTLCHNPCQRPSELPQGQPACVQLPQVKIHPCLLSQACWCPSRSHAACVPHPSAPAAPSRQALAPYLWGKGPSQEQAGLPQDPLTVFLDQVLCWMWVGGRKERMQIVREEDEERQKGRKETEAETQRGERGAESETKRRAEGGKGRD